MTRSIVAMALLACSFAAPAREVINEGLARIQAQVKALRRMEPPPGPGQCHKLVLISELDGDTLSGALVLYDEPTLFVLASVRLKDADTPETARHRAGCDAEVELGITAAAATLEWIGDHKVLWACNTDQGKFAGRTLADLKRPGDWADLRMHLIGLGLAKPYFGGTKADWCGG